MLIPVAEILTYNHTQVSSASTQRLKQALVYSIHLPSQRFGICSLPKNRSTASEVIGREVEAGRGRQGGSRQRLRGAEEVRSVQECTVLKEAYGGRTRNKKKDQREDEKMGGSRSMHVPDIYWSQVLYIYWG